MIPTSQLTTDHLLTLVCVCVGGGGCLVPPLWTLFPPQPTETLGAYEFLPSSLTGSRLLSFSVSSRLQRRLDHLPQGWGGGGGGWEDLGALKKWLASKNCWPKAFLLLLIIGFFTLSVLGNHWRVMMNYTRWKTSLNTFRRSDSTTYNFLLMNQRVQ